MSLRDDLLDSATWITVHTPTGPRAVSLRALFDYFKDEPSAPKPPGGNGGTDVDHSKFVPDDYKLTFAEDFALPIRIDNAFGPLPSQGASWQDAWSKWRIRHLVHNEDKGLKRLVPGKTHVFKDGNLQLRAYPDPGRDEHGESFPYRAGMISAERFWSQQYGYFECRIRFPRGVPQGCHFAGPWYLPKNIRWPPEVDQLEVVSVDDKLHFNDHGLDSPGMTSVGGYDRTKWMVIGLLWEPERLRWFVDGKLERDRRAKLQEPMFPLFSWEIGSKWVGKPAEGEWLAIAEIDYFRAYQK